MTNAATVTLLTANSLAFSYSQEKPTIDGVSLNLRAGDLTMIVGPNGCGKSTLLRLLLGELPPSAGSIIINNTPTTNLTRAQIARALSIVPQQSQITYSFDYTVREIILMARHVATANSLFNIGFETPQDIELANQSMWLTDTHHLAHRPITTLSGGERQRVTIARALTQNTPIMLLDEPTSSLDLHHQLELLHHLQTLTQKESRTALMITHDLNLASTYASKVIVMDQGKLITQGLPAEVLTPEILEPVYRVKITRSPDNTLHFARRTAL